MTIQFPEIQSASELQDALIDLGQFKYLGSSSDAWLSRIDNLKSAEELSTLEFALNERLIEGPTGEPVKLNMELTPYLRRLLTWCDMEAVNIIAISACSRWGKTITAETKFLKHWSYGPFYNTLWYMQSDSDLDDYIDERGEWGLLNHEKIAERINWADPRNSRKRKRIGESLALWRPATMRTTRGKASPLIAVDEIDGCNKKVANSMLTLVENRQREFGSARLAIFASHPDLAPNGGIWLIIRDSIQHRWYWRCPECHMPSSPCQDAETRMMWNVEKFLKRAEDMTREKLLRLIERETRLICPHCKAEIDDTARKEINQLGEWLQPHQTMTREGEVIGEYLVGEKMGAIGHAMMSPWIKIGKLAAAWAAAKITADTTGDDQSLREETVKSLGERYEGADEDTKVEDWKTVSTRLRSKYLMKTVPAGVKFLTAFVDVQGDRFEARVIGWDLAKRSWLIDAFPIKQWPAGILGKNPHGAFENIDPANRLSDWEIIEHAVIAQHYPLADNTNLFMPIAKTIVDAMGEPGVTNNARLWLSNALARKYLGTPGMIIEPYQVQLIQNSSQKKGETYGKPIDREFDDQNRKLPYKLKERMPIAYLIKKIIAKRMHIDDGAPGQMHLPSDLPDRYVRELVSEKLINDEWVPSGRNETWDGWVNCETARYLVFPDRPGLWEDPDNLPDWATPRPRSEVHGDGPAKPVSLYERYAKLNDIGD